MATGTQRAPQPLTRPRDQPGLTRYLPSEEMAMQRMWLSWPGGCPSVPFLARGITWSFRPLSTLPDTGRERGYWDGGWDWLATPPRAAQAKDRAEPLGAPAEPPQAPCLLHGDNNPKGQLRSPREKESRCFTTKATSSSSFS